MRSLRPVHILCPQTRREPDLTLNLTLTLTLILTLTLTLTVNPNPDPNPGHGGGVVVDSVRSYFGMRRVSLGTGNPNP